MAADGHRRRLPRPFALHLFIAIIILISRTLLRCELRLYYSHGRPICEDLNLISSRLRPREGATVASAPVLFCQRQLGGPK